jgi:hypothetical protein
MNQPKAFGSFIKRGEYTFRTKAYIQFGKSEKSVGSCLLLNPGSANFDKKSELYHKLQAFGSAVGAINTDNTTKQLIKFVEGIYGTEKPVNGRFHIYNLFTLQNTASSHAVEQFEDLVDSGEYNITESLVSIIELMSHPWVLLGWSVESKPSWRNFEIIKEHWRNLLTEAKIPTFGKKHKKSEDYYHPCPLIPTHQPTMLADLITIYKQKFNKQRFPIYATKPNLLIDSDPVEEINEFDFGWFKSSGNPESIVRGFSHLHIKSGYKLRAYQYSDGGNGNGIVYAIPADKDLPEPRDSEQIDDQFLSGPKPTFALDDFMQVIEGDKTPVSYLQASIAFHELHEFGAIWHGTSWGRDVILPINDDEATKAYKYEWNMIEDEPEIIEPHFYYNYDGNPVVVFHTINDIYTVTLNRYVHVFNKDDYTLNVERNIIATAEGGIIF